MLRSDIHEEAFVKAGARRVRDFPNIHSASSAAAERPCERSAVKSQRAVNQRFRDFWGEISGGRRELLESQSTPARVSRNGDLSARRADRRKPLQERR